MLRLVSFIFFIVVSTSLFGSDDQISVSGEREKIKNLSKEEINTQKRKTREALDQVDSLLKDGTISKLIQEENKKISDIEIDEGLGKMNLPDFIENQQNKSYMSSVYKEADKLLQSPNKAVNSTYSPPIVLVSFSMPDSELKSLLDEAQFYNSPVVLRGLYQGDFKATMERIQSVTGRSKPSGISIDPTLFSRFQIESVPAFVLPMEFVTRCSNSGCKTPDHVKATGSVSIQYFLELIDRTGKPNEQKVANHWLNKKRE